MNIEMIEKQVLGTAILNKNALSHILANINVGYFYSTKSKLLYDKIKTLDKAGKIIDETLPQSGILENQELDLYALDCVSSVATVECFDAYMSQFLEIRIKRELKVLASQLSQDISNDTAIPEMLDTLSQRVNSLKTVEQVDKKQILYDIINEYEELKIRGNEMNSGFPYFDKLTNGFKRKRLYILGGLPGSGKTGLALFLAHRMSFIQGKKVLFFSLEMSMFEIVGRLTSIINKIPAWKIQQPWTMQKEDFIGLTDTCDKLHLSSLNIIEGEQRITDIIARIQKEKPDMVFIDHLQHIPLNITKNEKEHTLLAAVVRSLKTISQTENTCIFLISQNKYIESGRYKDDTAEFRGSRSIKEQCDLGMMITRPKENPESLVEQKGLLNLHIIKNRHGESEKTVNLVLDSETLCFTEFFMQKER